MAEASRAVQAAIKNRALRDLDPGRSVVLAKTGFAVTLGGLISLLFCGQFGIGASSLAVHVNHALHARVGDTLCVFACGAFFSLLPVFIFRLICPPLQFKAICQRHSYAFFVAVLIFGGVLAYSGDLFQSGILYGLWACAAYASFRVIALVIRYVDRLVTAVRLTNMVS